MHVELEDGRELYFIICAIEKVRCNGPALRSDQWVAFRHNDHSHPNDLWNENITYWGRFGELQLFLWSEYRGAKSFLWIRLRLSEVLGMSLLPWAIFLALLLYRMQRRQSMAEKNLCISCGYDLCATPDRCPECGTVPAQKIKNSN